MECKATSFQEGVTPAEAFFQKPATLESDKTFGVTPPEITEQLACIPQVNAKAREELFALANQRKWPHFQPCKMVAIRPRLPTVKQHAADRQFRIQQFGPFMVIRNLGHSKYHVGAGKDICRANTWELVPVCGLPRPPDPIWKEFISPLFQPSSEDPYLATDTLFADSKHGFSWQTFILFVVLERMAMFHANEDKPSTTVSNRLEEYLLLAKSAHGAAAVDLIRRVTEAPGVYTFGELLRMPNISALKDGPHQTWVEFLRIFAYGTVKNYKEREKEFPALSAAQLQKLRHLTVVTLATREKSIPYSTLQDGLEIVSVRELEDLIIESCYAGIIQAKLDQKRNMVEVSFVIGRDVEDQDKKTIINTLEAWCDTCETLLGSLQKQILVSNQAREAHVTVRTSLEQQVASIRMNQRSNKEDGECGDAGDVLNPGRSTPMLDKTKKQVKARLTRGSANNIGTNRWK
ncbi:unnamed protein product [Notodromas monacha]|uniref:PCI domain-containing protein n=1 Tax=Notodromas monacha TaxID=399045 RepID=A0A7R9BV31_9CRUS|nr:unnamed protein product [Notodromas monacha]CAG0921927.1 unnamed protein product [Notodromas monacha]